MTPTPSLTSESKPSVAPKTADPLVTAEPSAAWAKPVRVSRRDYGELSLVVDAAGIAHAAAVLDDSIYYLTNASGSWTRKRLSRPLPDGADGEPSIALDGDGSLAVAFTRFSGWACGELSCSPYPSEGIFVIHNRAGEWSHPAAATENGVRPLLKSRSGVHHLVFNTPQWSDGLAYAMFTGEAWQAEDLAAGAWGADLTVGDDGLARVAYRTEQGIEYAVMDGDSKPLQVPVTSDIERIVLVLGAADAPTIYFSTGGWPAELHRLRLLDPLWTEAEHLGEAQIIAGAADMEEGLHLLIRAPASAEDEHPPALWYASDGSGELNRERLEPGQPVMADAPESPSAIAVDSLSRPHLLWVVRDHGASRDGLWYAVGPAD
jgi:hypothetical protein